MARAVSVTVGVGLILDGALLAVLTAVTPVGVLRHLVEASLSLGVLMPGVVLVRTGLDRRRPLAVRLLAGEIVLDGALLSLGAEMPAYQAGGVPYGEGVGQFVGVLIALCLGAAALALSSATWTTPSRPDGLSLAGALRDSLILITGTIVLAIGLTQLALPRLLPPQWNWISFLGITVPGMLLLIVREGLTHIVRARGARPGRGALTMIARLLLVIGLTVMLYGSEANLILGRNGFEVGIRGDGVGLALWCAAAAFLAVTSERLAMSPRSGGWSRRRDLLRSLMFVVGTVALIDGERSAVMGRSPALVAGGAFPAALPIILAAILVLVVGRSVGIAAPAPDVQAG
jgi:hypothetical protein